MLITIDSSIDRLDLNDTGSILSVENILNSHFDGQNMVHGDRLTLVWIYKNVPVGIRASAALKKIINNYAQDSKGLARFRRRVVVYVGDPPAISSSFSWLVPLDWFSRLEATLAPVLLGENSLDANMYLESAKHRIKYDGLRGVVPKLRPQGGGGNTTWREFENCGVYLGQMVLCVTDSDRKRPAATTGDTSKKCEKVSRRPDCVVCEHLGLEEREVENILPELIVSNSVNPHLRAVYSQSLAALDDANHMARWHWDVKKGLKGSWVFGLKPGSADRRFWEPVVQQALSGCGDSEVCVSGGVCMSPKECGCVAAEGLGGNLLELVCDKMRDLGAAKVFSLVENDPSASRWFAIGEVALEWGCAPERSRV